MSIIILQQGLNWAMNFETLLDGTWKVKVTSGPKWFRGLNILRDKKYILDQSGCNYIAGIAWGTFEIFFDVDKLEYTFTYNKYPIVDILNPISDNVLSGKFYYKDKLIGDFKMTRIDKDKPSWFHQMFLLGDSR